MIQKCMGLFLVLISIWTFKPLSFGKWEFITRWDDLENFEWNDMILHIDQNTVWRMLTEERIFVYEPVSWFIKSLINAGFGLNSHCFRIIACIFHLISCIVLMQSVARMLQILHPKLSPDAIYFGCGNAATFFCIHPLNIEVIGWPSAHSYTSTMLFASLSVYSHIESRTNSSYKIIAVSCYGFALMSKSISLSFLAVYPLIDIVLALPTASSCKQLIKTGYHQVGSNVQYLPVFFTMLYMTLKANADATWEHSDLIYLSWQQRVHKAVILHWWIIGKLFWPSELRMNYQIFPENLNLENPECLLSWTATILMILVCGFQLFVNHKPLVLLAWMYYIALILPISGIVQHGMVVKVCDRYAYFPILLLIPVFGFLLASSYQPTKRFVFHTCVPMYALLLCTSLISQNQLNSWRTEEDAYRHSLSIDPTDWRILDLIAELKQHAGDIEKAQEYWTLSSFYLPECGVKTILAKAKVLVVSGDMDAACEFYETNIVLYPDNVHLINNVAVCLLRKAHRVQGLNMFMYASTIPSPPKIQQVIQRNINLATDWDGVAPIYPRLLY